MKGGAATRKPQHLAYKLGIMIGLIGLAILSLPAILPHLKILPKIIVVAVN